MTQDTPLSSVLQNAGKVIAVHINYPSRAAERGRTPSHPSYFLKPSTSLSTGGGIERPAGCELFSFEGEIALIIGRNARRISPEEAWKHVLAVTASNDLGVYDLRAADKGSNLRSKGADGFTPLGPELIPAERIDPQRLKIRTWLNGKIVQEDTTEDLLFPLPILISDLSQLITLEAGDIILTGTPAGASVARPGDVIDVEVSAFASGKRLAEQGQEVSLSSGLLSSTVLEGTATLPSFSAQPEANEHQRAEAWGAAYQPPSSPETAPDTNNAPVLSPQIRQRLKKVATATLNTILRKKGIENCSIEGLSATQPGRKAIGVARTLRYIPLREDLAARRGGGFNCQKQAIESLKEGEILVMEARGVQDAGTFGDILALRAQVRGAAGIISDGGVRDLSSVSSLDIPAFYASSHPAVLGRRHVPWEIDSTIACGGATVQPGDVIVADEDGIVVIPIALLEEVSTEAQAQELQDDFVLEQVRQGQSIEGLFPPTGEWKERFERWAKERA